MTRVENGMRLKVLENKTDDDTPNEINEKKLDNRLDPGIGCSYFFPPGSKKSHFSTSDSDSS